MERENQDLVSAKSGDNISYDFKGYYTVKEVASIMRVTVRTIYNWHRNEELIPIKIGGRYYHCKKEIDLLAKIN
ncbi:helix-turn-helix domain-containing protein [Empedobacter falsenii]